jgi:hypothetical protein
LYASSFCKNVFTEPLLRNSSLFIGLLHSNGCTHCLFRGLFSAVGLNATVLINKWHYEEDDTCCDKTQIDFTKQLWIRADEYRNVVLHIWHAIGASEEEVRDYRKVKMTNESRRGQN